MRAAIYPGGGGPIAIETLPDPEPQPGELLIRVARCGICGTDLTMTKGGAWDYGAGARFGHEFAGEVIDIGAGVEGFAMGDRIAVLPSQACGRCPTCAHGNNTMCRNAGGVMGGFAELASVPAAVAVRLPATLSMTDGALVEPMAVSLYGVRRSGIAAGTRVLVLGAGAVALTTVYWARRLGAGRIAAISRAPRHRDLALAMGADAYLTYGDAEVGEAADALGGAPEIVFECVGVPGMLGKAVTHCAPFGRVVSLGFCTAPDPVMPAVAAYKCATIQFAVGYTMEDFLHVADQMDKGHADPKALVTSTVALLDMPAAFEALRSHNVETKVHVIASG